MYNKLQSIMMNHSASAIGNNLSLNIIEERSVIHYAVVAGHYVNLLSVALDGHSVNQKEILCKYPDSAYPSLVHQAKLLPTASKLILSICAEEGLLLFDAENTSHLFSHRFVRQTNNESDCFSKGVCCYEFDKICFGTSYGELMMIEVPRQATNKFKHTQTLPLTSSAIWDVTNHKEHILAGSDDGAIFVLSCTEGKLNQLLKINGFGYPCTSLIGHCGRVIGSYGSGHICLFDLKSGSLLCEVAAHARWINCLDIARDDNLLLSAGEDTYIRLWSISKDLNRLEHMCNILMDDLLVQGAKFVGPHGSTIAVTGYDSLEIKFLQKS